MQQASINDPAALPAVIKSGTPFDWFLQRLVLPNLLTVRSAAYFTLAWVVTASKCKKEERVFYLIVVSNGYGAGPMTTDFLLSR